MTQCTLNFDVPAQSHSPTSVAAAESIQASAASYERLALTLFRLAGDKGLTDYELEDLMENKSARPRRIGLLHKGQVRDSGLTRVNPQSKKACSVWLIVGLLLMVSGCAAPRYASADIKGYGVAAKVVVMR